MTDWPIEVVPDADSLYMRLLAMFVVAGEIQPGCFRAHGTDDSRGMSTDWDKYSTPAETRKRAESKPPSAYGVLSMIVGSVRGIEGLSVRHAPSSSNQAHTNVNGVISDPEVDHTEVRERLASIADLVIDPSQPVL